MTITSASLNNYVTSGMAALQADKAAVTRGHHLSFQFELVNSNSPLSVRSRDFIVPRNCFVETVFVYGESSATQSVTIEITGDGALVNWPISITGLFNASILTALPRTWFNNASTKYGDRGFRVLPQGSTIRVEVKPSSTSNVNFLTVGLVLRQFFGR